GNKIDLNEIDYLQYLIQDPQTEIIGLYLESIQRGRELLEMARSTSKPIIVHKANIGETSKEIAKLHTSALANDDQIVEMALKQADIIRAKDFRSFINAVKVLSLPPMKGNDLVILSRSGGIAIIAADSAERYGFRLFPMKKSFQERIHNYFRAKVIKPTNPLDLGDLFDFNLYIKILEQVLKIKDVDGMIFQHAAIGDEVQPSRRLIHTAKELSFRYQKPVAFCYLTEEEELAFIKRTFDFPIFTEPEDALSALAISREHYRKRSLPKEKPTDYPVDFNRAKRLIRRARREKRDPTLPEALEIIRAYGIPVADYLTISQKEDLERAMKRIGIPVALKLVSNEVIHKSDIGGVVLHIDQIKRAEDVYDRMKGIGLKKFEGVLVQKMVSRGKEVILGGKRDPSFGPVVLFGMGGIYVEVLKETSLRVAPINRSEAEEMITELKGSALLKGVRGEKPADIKALIENLLRLSQLMVDFTEIEGIDINPVMVLEKGAIAVDARIVLKKG
ncbi:MAG: acetate--CoA ligase family protein, partial [Thermodesulfobacteriota bacterium]